MERNLFNELKGIIRKEFSDINGYEEHNTIPSDHEFFFKLFGSYTMICIRIDDSENLNLWFKHTTGLGYKEIAVANYAYDRDYIFIVRNGEFANTKFLKSDVKAFIDNLIDVNYFLVADEKLERMRREFHVEEGDEISTLNEVDRFLGKTVSVVNGHKIKEEYLYSKNEIRKIIYRFFKVSEKFNKVRIGE